MRGGHNAPTSVLVSSNLRRAAQTLFVSHWKRLTTTGKFHYPPLFPPSAPTDHLHLHSHRPPSPLPSPLPSPSPRPRPRPRPHPRPHPHLRPRPRPRPRLGETVKIISSLQEISRNVDTLVLCHAQKPVPLPGVSECLELDGAVPLGMQDCVVSQGEGEGEGEGECWGWR